MPVMTTLKNAGLIGGLLTFTASILLMLATISHPANLDNLSLFQIKQGGDWVASFGIFGVCYTDGVTLVKEVLKNPLDVLDAAMPRTLNTRDNEAVVHIPDIAPRAEPGRKCGPTTLGYTVPPLLGEIDMPKVIRDLVRAMFFNPLAACACALGAIMWLMAAACHSVGFRKLTFGVLVAALIFTLFAFLFDVILVTRAKADIYKATAGAFTGHIKGTLVMSSLAAIFMVISTLLAIRPLYRYAETYSYEDEYYQ